MIKSFKKQLEFVPDGILPEFFDWTKASVSLFNAVVDQMNSATGDKEKANIALSNLATMVEMMDNMEAMLVVGADDEHSRKGIRAAFVTGRKINKEIAMEENQ